MVDGGRREEVTVDVEVADRPPFEPVPCQPLETTARIRRDDRRRVMVDTIHDGDVVPPAFLVDHLGNEIDREDYFESFVRERDWGASMIARKLAERLGLDCYHRVTISRVLLDFGRFPGSTSRGADFMERYAINDPFSELLGPTQKRRLLGEYYDRISDEMELAIRGKRIKIAVHTYDRTSPSGAVRPEMSVITRSRGVERGHQGARDVFDELYPQVLGDFTADPVLRDRISLTLQKQHIFVEPNYPYSLPEGSVEVRSQVWFFFDELRRRFQDARPDTVDHLEYQLVWRTLLDTNLRLAECEAFRSYLRSFRRADGGTEQLFRRAADAHAEIGDFLRRDQGRIIREYRDSPERLNSILIEVRKDRVWELDENGVPRSPVESFAERVGDAVAEAVHTYLEHDRPAFW